MDATTRTIDDPRAARWMISSKRLRWLLLFIARPMTLHEVASLEKLSLSTLRFWVKRFEDIGVLQRAGQDEAGRLLYSLAAPRVVVPLDTDISLEAFQEAFKPYWLQFAHSVVLEGASNSEKWGILLFMDQDGMPNVAWRPMSRIDAPDLHLDLPGVNQWLQVRLTAADAHAVWEELFALQQRIMRRSQEAKEGKVHLLHLGMIANHGDWEN